VKENGQRKHTTSSSRTAHLDLLPFDTLPLQAQRPNQRQARHRHTHIPRLRQGLVVRDQHSRQELRRNRALQRRGTQPQHHRRIEPPGFLDQAGHETVGEDVLRDRDEQRASEGLREHDERGADGDVFDGQHALHGDEGLLHCDPDTESIEDLVADPFRRGSVDGESGEEPGTDGHEDRGGDEEGHVVADCCYAGAAQDGEEDEGEHEG
jgi:hypothetical protein